MTLSSITLTDRVRTDLTRACADIETWNQAIYAARAREDATGRAGYYEHTIRVDKKHIPMRLGASRGAHLLDILEDAIRGCGRTPQALYEAFGTPRPQIEPEGPHVVDWFDGGH